MYYLRVCDSVKTIFNNFLKNQGLGSLTSFYYTINEAKLFPEEWQFNLIDMIISKAMMPENQILFFVTDDTLVEK